MLAQRGKTGSFGTPEATHFSGFLGKGRRKSRMWGSAGQKRGSGYALWAPPAPPRGSPGSWIM